MRSGGLATGPGGTCFQINLHAPTGECARMNESSPAHVASLNLDRLQGMDFQNKERMFEKCLIFSECCDIVSLDIVPQHL